MHRRVGTLPYLEEPESLVGDHEKAEEHSGRARDAVDPVEDRELALVEPLRAERRAVLARPSRRMKEAAVKSLPKSQTTGRRGTCSSCFSSREKRASMAHPKNEAIFKANMTEGL
jgi:hypothetical protein